MRDQKLVLSLFARPDSHKINHFFNFAHYLKPGLLVLPKLGLARIIFVFKFILAIVFFIIFKNIVQFLNCEKQRVFVCSLFKFLAMGAERLWFKNCLLQLLLFVILVSFQPRWLCMLVRLQKILNFPGFRFRWSWKRWGRHRSWLHHSFNFYWQNWLYRLARYLLWFIWGISINYTGKFGLGWISGDTIWSFDAFKWNIWQHLSGVLSAIESLSWIVLSRFKNGLLFVVGICYYELL